MNGLVQDMRYALRALAKSPGFTAAAVLTLALGIGTNTATFSVVRAVLLRPLPYADGGRAVMVFEHDSAGNVRLASFPTFEDWRTAATAALDGLAYVRGRGTVLKSAAGAERLVGAYVTDDFFHVLREPALVGRTFQADDMRAGAAPVVVLSHHLWRRRFGGDPAAVGRAVTLGDFTYTVVGVMPSDFGYPTWADLWAPLATIAATDRAVAERGFHADSRVVGRLRAGTDSAGAERLLGTVAARLATEYPLENAGWGAVSVVPVSGDVVGDDVAPRLRLLTAAVALVLLIACVNIANLSLARGAGHSRELAIRAALGAGGGALLRRLFAESALLALGGGVAGLVGALWATDWIRAHAADALPRMEEVGIDGGVVAFTGVVLALAAVLFGLLPTLRAAPHNLANALTDRAVGARTGRWQGRLRSWLVVSEVALALMLVAGAGLLIRSLWHLQQVDPGFRLEHLLSLQVEPPSPRYDDPARALDLYRHLAEAAGAVPGVRAAALTNHVPFSGASMPSRIEVEGTPTRPAGDEQALFRVVDAAYFSTMQIPLVRGRGFTRSDIDHPGDALIVNQALARRYWPGSDPVGRRMTVYKSAQGRPDFGQPVRATVVGVVGDVRHYGLDIDVVPEVYLPYTLTAWPRMALVVRTGDDSARTAGLRRAVLAVDPDIPLEGPSLWAGVHEVSELLDSTLAPRRLANHLLIAFAVPALLLAALGIYGVIAYLVTGRTREIGIRMALGAERRDVLRLVLGQGMRLALLGVALGAAGALAAAQLLASQLYGVTATDPATLIGAAAVGLLASYLPARHATRVNPVRALRQD